MKVTFIEIIFIITNIVTFVKGGIVPSNRVTDSSQKCSYEQFSLDSGDSVLIHDKCAMVTCYDGYLKAFTCGKVFPEEGCKIIKEMDKSYPLCCPRLVCDGESFFNKYRTRRDSDDEDEHEESDDDDDYADSDDSDSEDDDDDDDDDEDDDDDDDDSDDDDEKKK